MEQVEIFIKKKILLFNVMIVIIPWFLFSFVIFSVEVLYDYLAENKTSDLVIVGSLTSLFKVEILLLCLFILFFTIRSNLLFFQRKIIFKWLIF